MSIGMMLKNDVCMRQWKDINNDVNLPQSVCVVARMWYLETLNIRYKLFRYIDRGKCFENTLSNYYYLFYYIKLFVIRKALLNLFHKNPINVSVLNNDIICM